MAFMVLTPMILLWGVYSFSSYRTLAEEIQSETLAADKAHAEMAGQFIFQHQQGLLARIMAVAEEQAFAFALVEESRDAVASHLTNLGSESELDHLFVTDKYGREIISISPRGPALSFKPHKEKWLKELLSNPRPYFSGVTFQPAPSSRSFLFIAAPVYDRDGELVGILGGVQNLNMYTEFYARLSARPGRTFYLLDAAGNVIAGGPDTANRFGLLHLARYLAATETRPNRAAGEVMDDPTEKQPIFISAASIPELSWIFVITHDYATVMAPVQIMFRDITVFLVLLFFCLFVMGALLVSRYEMQKKAYSRMDEEARRLEAEVLARTMDLNRSTARIRELSHQLIRTQEEERQRLALDLHDEMGQVVSALKIGLQSMAGRPPMDIALRNAEFKKLIALSQKIMDRVRALAYNLRPAILDNFGLTAAIEDLCESVSESSQMKIERHLPEVEENRLSPEVKTTLFRFVQEGLTNSLRYAGSPNIEVGLSIQDLRLRVWVRDQGRGFDVEQTLGRALAEKKLGLIGMTERVDLIGGRLTVKSGPTGTILMTEVELRDNE